MTVLSKPKTAEPTPEEIERELFTVFRIYAVKCLKVQTKKGKLISFKFNVAQDLLDQIVNEIIAAGRLVRVVVLKARREGVSTYVEGRFYWKVSLRENRYAATVTHEPEATETLFNMTKRFHDHVDPLFQPPEKYNNKGLLQFEGLDSAFRVGTAEKEHFGSGQGIHYLHLCLSPDTPILICDGKEKPVKDVVAGDVVITHNGNRGRVVAVSSKKADDLPDKGKMVVVHPWLGYPISLTPQHKVWTNMGWVQAGDLDPNWHMVSMPIREIRNLIASLPVEGRRSRFGPGYRGPKEFPLNEETGFSVGYYLAEGCLSGNGGVLHRIIFTLHQNEWSFARRATAPLLPFCKSGPKIKNRKGTLTSNFSLDSSILADFFDKHFGRVDGKRIPDWVFDCGEDFCRGIVLGYLAGDGSKGIQGGHQGYGSNVISACSIRESLTYQVRDLVAALGYGWGSVKFTSGGLRYGRKCRPKWTVSFNGECGMKLRKDIGIPYAEIQPRAANAERYRLDFQNRKVWLRIKKIAEGYSDVVYDLGIDHSDHSFRTPHFAVSNSEVSKWPAHTQVNLLTSALQAVPDDPDTEIFYESTAYGIGGAFHHRYLTARYRYYAVLENGKPVLKFEINEDANPDDVYTSVFFPWFIFPEYRMKAPADFVRTKEEVEYAKLHGVDDDQLYWRRYTIANKCNPTGENLGKTPEMIFWQEYPSTPEEAFLATGRTIFDTIKVNAFKKAAPKPIARYDCLVSTGQWIAKPDGALRVWEEPIPGRRYVIGADVAEGLIHGDFDSADVVDHLTGKQVAQWHGKVDPDLFGNILYWLGVRYCTAWIAPERNNHGYTTVKKLVDLRYPQIYVEMVPEPPGKPRKRYGWLTGPATKHLLIDFLVTILREGRHGIQCAETFGEMLSFVLKDDGKLGAQEGLNDDRVMSMAIAQYVRTTLPLPSMSQTLVPAGGAVQSVRTPPPPGAFT